jgi:hypothetical protein
MGLGTSGAAFAPPHLAASRLLGRATIVAREAEMRSSAPGVVPSWVLAAAVGVSACGFDTCSDQYECPPPPEACADGRVCVDGWCVVPGADIDASVVVPDGGADLDASADGGCPGPALGFTPSNSRCATSRPPARRWPSPPATGRSTPTTAP